MSIIPLEHKAAGHDGPLQSDDGSLFIKPTTSQEIEFYNETQNRRMKIPDDIGYGESLSDWMPQYLGVLYPGASNDLIRETGGRIDPDLLNKATDTLEVEGSNKQYLILNNCLHGFSKPSIMDIKLGSVLYDANASAEKIERMKNVSKNTTSGSLKFRIAGMVIKDDFDGKLPNDLPNVKMYEVCTKKFEKGYITFNKYFGRKLNKETVEDGLQIFFRYNKLSTRIQNLIIENFYARLQLLYNCLLDEEVRIVSGSLFFVYENDVARWEKLNYKDPIIAPEMTDDDDDDDNSQHDANTYEEKDYMDDANAPLSLLKIIDFAHAEYTPTMGYDEEIVSGIENIFKIIENI